MFLISINLIILIFVSRLRVFLSRKQGIVLADRVIKLYFLERNIKIIIINEKGWPLLDVASFIVPDLFMIWELSSKLGVESPVPKLPLVDVGPDGARNKFGWEGSIDFCKAAAIGKELDSLKPTIATEGALEYVLAELEEAFIGASNYNNAIDRIELLHTSVLENTSSLSSSSSSSSSAITAYTSDISPQPNRKNKRSYSGAKSDHSNKGEVGSHKTTKNLQMATKV